MSFFQIYVTCALGIVISVLLPILRQSLPRPTTAVAPESFLGDLWKVARPYLALGLVSLLGAFLIVAFLGDSLMDWRAALVAGYAWDSTLQKIGTTPASGG
jgi:hypothetical protein